MKLKLDKLSKLNKKILIEFNRLEQDEEETLL